MLQLTGFDKLELHHRQMGQFILAQANQRDYVEVVNGAPDADCGTVISLKVPSTPNLDDVARVPCDSYGIMSRNGHLCAQPYVTKKKTTQVLWIVAYVYTTEQDILRFFDALDEIRAMFFS
jgi:cysteine desulfurase/selenocysteine lyase